MLPAPALDDHTPQAPRLRQFLTWALRIAMPSAFVELGAGVILQTPSLVLLGVITLGIIGCMAWARATADRGEPQRAAAILCITMLGALSVTVLMLPVLLPALVVGVLLVVTLGLPYLAPRAHRQLLISAGIVGGLITILARIAPLQQLFPAMPAPVADGLVISVTVIILGLTLFLLWQFSSRLSETLASTQAAHAALEVTHADLAAQADQLRTAEQQLLDLVVTLETPTIMLTEGVLLAPIVGHMDDRRQQALTTRLLQAVHDHRTRLVLLDIAGIGAVDSSVARGLIATVQAVRLLGCQVVITGISADVALTLTQLDLSLDGIATVRSPQEVLVPYVTNQFRVA